MTLCKVVFSYRRGRLVMLTPDLGCSPEHAVPMEASYICFCVSVLKETMASKRRRKNTVAVSIARTRQIMRMQKQH